MSSSYPAISIIVPVYKAEKYLHKCLDSILAQTFTDFEVLLIDDGSPDRSGEICDEYAAKDSRMRVFHKENGGVSAARQTGMDNALGEWTIHVDPDDWVEPTMLEELYKKAKETDADMVICDYFQDIGNCSQYIDQVPSSLDHIEILKGLFRNLQGSCWNKLVKRDCYSRYGIRFPKGINICEDRQVNMELLIHDIKVAYHPAAFYHYVIGINQNSLVQNSRVNTDYRANLFFIEFVIEKCSMLPGEYIVKYVVDNIYSVIISSNLSQKQFNNLFSKYKCYVQESVACPLRTRFIVRTSYMGLKRFWRCLGRWWHR